MRRRWMRLSFRSMAFAAIAGMVVMAATLGRSAERSRPGVRAGDADDALRAGVDAYIYGYPLVTIEVTRSVVTNAAYPDLGAMRAPMNQILSLPQYPNASFRAITAPNADTLYSTAFIDLSKEPQVLHIPAMGE